ncbi:hypothetical protein BDY17DRAFT_176435 [Neohortaea acidophila]|uniref:Uncharacterized protein n=1 Tax=Neohortaea acidophila TaxID=245834 RepID=A0A6A6PPP6_9PEZI|nr:uncharacterized protein BDY17DRAFT_176435 [Neohortaea acidophila]KAF2482059.1 hypothetical protein BDY17DRAFT_176435 [Neohortaea acidophila]
MASLKSLHDRSRSKNLESAMSILWIFTCIPYGLAVSHDALCEHLKEHGKLVFDSSTRRGWLPCHHDRVTAEHRL